MRWDDVEASSSSNSSSSTSLLSSSKAVARTVHVKTTTTTTTTSTIDDGTTATTATTTSIYSTPLTDLRDRQGRRLYSLSVGGLSASQYDPHPQPTIALVSDPYRYAELEQQQEIPHHNVRAGGHEAGGGGRDKWNPHLGSKIVVQENKQTVLQGKRYLHPITHFLLPPPLPFPVVSPLPLLTLSPSVIRSTQIFCSSTSTSRPYPMESSRVSCLVPSTTKDFPPILWGVTWLRTTSTPHTRRFCCPYFGF